jgi:hypothetical protein
MSLAGLTGRRMSPSKKSTPAARCAFKINEHYEKVSPSQSNCFLHYKFLILFLIQWNFKSYVQSHKWPQGGVRCEEASWFHLSMTKAVLASSPSLCTQFLDFLTSSILTYSHDNSTRKQQQTAPIPRLIISRSQVWIVFQYRCFVHPSFYLGYVMSKRCISWYLACSRFGGRGLESSSAICTLSKSVHIQWKQASI